MEVDFSFIGRMAAVVVIFNAVEFPRTKELAEQHELLLMLEGWFFRQQCGKAGLSKGGNKCQHDKECE